MLSNIYLSPPPRFIVTTSEDRTCRVWNASNGQQHALFSWKSGQGDELLTIKFPSFFGTKHLLLSAAGPRGPGRLGIYAFTDPAKADDRVFEATVDAKPASALKLNQNCTLMCLGFVTGNKSIFSVDLPGFEKGVAPFKRLHDCGTMKKPVHNLPVMKCAFVGVDTTASASGDRTVHFGPELMLSGGPPRSGGNCCCYFLVLIVFIAVSGVGGFFYINGMTWESVRQLEIMVYETTGRRAADVQRLIEGFQTGEMPQVQSQYGAPAGGMGGPGQQGYGAGGPVGGAYDGMNLDHGAEL